MESSGGPRAFRPWSWKRISGITWFREPVVDVGWPLDQYGPHTETNVPARFDACRYLIHMRPWPHFPATGDSPWVVNSRAIDNIGSLAESVRGSCQMMTPSAYVHPSVNDSLSIFGVGLPSLCQEVE